MTISSTNKIKNMNTSRFIRLLFITAFLVIGIPAGMAQRHDTQRMSREELAERQANHIASAIKLDKNDTQRYVRTYCSFQKELWALGPRLGKKSKSQAHAMTEEQLETSMEQRFERSQQILNLRRKYYNEYKKFLTPQQIDNAYKHEKALMNRLSKHRKNRKR